MPDPFTEESDHLAFPRPHKDAPAQGSTAWYTYPRHQCGINSPNLPRSVTKIRYLHDTECGALEGRPTGITKGSFTFTEPQP